MSNDDQTWKAQASLRETTEGVVKWSADSICAAITRFWQESLEVETMRGDDNFFDLGGTSLGLVRVLTHINEHFGVSLDAG